MAGCCQKGISPCHALLIFVVACLLAGLGIAMVIYGIKWDGMLAGSIYVAITNGKWPSGDVDSFYTVNRSLFWPGILLTVPMIPALLVAFRRIRGMAIVFMLSIPVAIAGSVIACIFSGCMWKEMLVIFRAMDDTKCYNGDSCCVCTLVPGKYINKTVNVQVAVCGKIGDIHDAINAYFALAITAVVISMSAVYIAFMVICTPETKIPGYHAQGGRPQHYFPLYNDFQPDPRNRQQLTARRTDGYSPLDPIPACPPTSTEGRVQGPPYCNQGVGHPEAAASLRVATASGPTVQANPDMQNTGVGAEESSQQQGIASRGIPEYVADDPLIDLA